MPQGGDQGGEGDFLKATGTVDEPGALAAVAAGVEREVDVGHRPSGYTEPGRTADGGEGISAMESGKRLGWCWRLSRSLHSFASRKGSASRPEDSASAMPLD
jgi:hypothetical protein